MPVLNDREKTHEVFKHQCPGCRHVDLGWPIMTSTAMGAGLQSDLKQFPGLAVTFSNHSYPLGIKKVSPLPPMPSWVKSKIISGGFTQAQATKCRNSRKLGSTDGNPGPPPPRPAHFKDTKPINREHSESCCQWLEENRYRESHNDDKSRLCSSLTNVGTKTHHEYPALKRVTLLRGQSISSSQWTTLK